MSACNNCNATGIVIYANSEMECLRCLGSGDTDKEINVPFARLPEAQRASIRREMNREH